MYKCSFITSHNIFIQRKYPWIFWCCYLLVCCICIYDMRVLVWVHRYQARANTRGYHLGVSSLLARQTWQAILLAKVYSKETIKPGKYCKGKAVVGQLLCKQVPRDFPCKSCTPDRIVFPTTPFQGKCFLLERQRKAEAPCQSPTQVHVWVLCTKQNLWCNSFL